MYSVLLVDLLSGSLLYEHHSQEEIKGTGLGLSIVRRAVEAHDGHIEVESIPGEATRFEIILPPQRVHDEPEGMAS